MHRFGAKDHGEVVGGLLVPRVTIHGSWVTLDEAFRRLAEGSTTRVVVPDGGAATTALAAGPGSVSREVGPAQIAVRVRGARPSQARHDADWLRHALASEHMRPVAGDVHWVIGDDGVRETWMPIAVQRRLGARRPACVR
jgi:hypothetical protein